MIEKMMAVPNQIWDSIIARAAENSSVLQDPEIIKQLGHILKINVRGSTSIGHPFVAQVSHPHFCHGWNRCFSHALSFNSHCCLILALPLSQLGRIYMDMLNLYKCLSENISQAVALSGTVVQTHVHTHNLLHFIIHAMPYR